MKIPAMTHELGRHWIQPDHNRILVDDKHAVMSEATFRELAEYSSSIPSGVYDGKMWKRNDGVHDRWATVEPVWLLMWFGPSTDPNKCSINHRVILLT